MTDLLCLGCSVELIVQNGREFGKVHTVATAFRLRYGFYRKCLKKTGGKSDLLPHGREAS